MVKLVRDIGSVIVDGNNESNLVNVTFGQFVGDDVVVSEVYVVLDWDSWLGADMVFDDSKGTFKSTPDKTSAIKKSDFQDK
jgi:hypothetical protein